MSIFGVNAALMDTLPDLKLIACNGAGLERIDLSEAKRRGIAVCHTPDELAEDVADGAIALTYAIMRRIVEADRFVRAGRWTKERMAPSRRLAGKTVGIVGLGKIGRVVAQRAQAIGMSLPLYPRSLVRGLVTCLRIGGLIVSTRWSKPSEMARLMLPSSRAAVPIFTK